MPILGLADVEVTRIRAVERLAPQDLDITLGRHLPSVVVVDIVEGDAPSGRLPAELRSRFPRLAIVALLAGCVDDRARQLLRLGVVPMPKAISMWTLAGVALCLRSQARALEATSAESGWPWRDQFDRAVAAYASLRHFSAQQTAVLTLYLSGKTDKEIAALRGCSAATVYEHWRRMAKKSGATLKNDAIADFHRFLGR